MKRIIILLILICTLLMLFAISVSAVSINDESIFVKQANDSDGTCVFTACLNMFRRRAIIDGITDWQDITHANYKKAITTNGVSVRFEITNVKGMNAKVESVSKKTTEEKKNYFMSMLQQHPEGIVIYRNSNSVMHTILLTDYTDGIFYCVESATYDHVTGKNYPRGRIPLTSTWLGYNTTSQDSAISMIHQIWYITNKSGGGELHIQHSYNTFKWYGDNHPHYAYYECSCGDIQAKEEFGYLTSCEECITNHSHTPDKYLYYGDNHPHYLYYQCRCGEIIAQGTTKLDFCVDCHIHSYNTFKWYGEYHPHYAYYECSCGDIKAKEEFGYLTSCEECITNHSHTPDKYLYYGDNHPHYLYYQCRCGEIIAQGTTLISSCINCIYTKTTLSSVDDRIFNVEVFNVPLNSQIIMALYKDSILVEFQSVIYNGETTLITFTPKNNCDSAKVMVWESFETLRPICDFEQVDLLR